LKYDSKSVRPVGLSDELPGVKGAANLGFGNHTINGVLITDKSGKPFGLGLRIGAHQIDPTGKRVAMRMTLELFRDRDGTDPPASVTFWGSQNQQIEVPITLKDVTLYVGK
jgi:hypothetical protein